MNIHQVSLAEAGLANIQFQLNQGRRASRLPLAIKFHAFGVKRVFLLTLVLATTVSAQQIKNAVPYAARPLPLSAVRLTGGPLKRAQDLNAEYLLKLEPDRMLAFYRGDLSQRGTRETNVRHFD